MQFLSERTAIEEVAALILDAAANLYKSTKYIYALSRADFYSCSVKDVFKVILNNLRQVDTLQALGLHIDAESCPEMATAEYEKVFSLLVYSFAVRLPTLQRVQIQGERLSDAQIQAIYDYIMQKGIANHGELVAESFADMKVRIRKKQQVVPYNADWYKAFLYTYVPSLAEINNRNVFLFGTVDILFMMYYMRLEEELQAMLTRYSAKASRV